MNPTDICYLTLPANSADEASSLAAYLTGHGITAVSELNEVTIPMDDPARAADVMDLRKNWALYWQHSDSEIFGLPIFQKSECSDCVGTEG